MFKMVILIMIVMIMQPVQIPMDHLHVPVMMAMKETEHNAQVKYNY